MPPGIYPEPRPGRSCSPPSPKSAPHRGSQGRRERRECASRPTLPVPGCPPPAAGPASSRRHERGIRVGPRVLASQKLPAPPTQLPAPPKVVRGAGGAKTRPLSAAEPRDRTYLTGGPGPETSHTRVSRRPLSRPAWGTRPRPVRAAARLGQTVPARRTTGRPARVATAPVSDRAARVRGKCSAAGSSVPRTRPQVSSGPEAQSRHFPPPGKTGCGCEPTEEFWRKSKPSRRRGAGEERTGVLRRERQVPGKRGSEEGPVGRTGEGTGARRPAGHTCS